MLLTLSILHLQCTFDATSIPVSRSKGQRSRTPCPLMLTPIVRYIFRTARSTNFKLGTRMEGDDRISHRCTTSKVKVARSRDQSELSWPNVSLAAGGAYRVGRTRRSHFLFLCVLHCHDYCFSKLLYLTQQMLLVMMMMMMNRTYVLLTKFSRAPSSAQCRPEPTVRCCTSFSSHVLPAYPCNPPSSRSCCKYTSLIIMIALPVSL